MTGDTPDPADNELSAAASRVREHLGLSFPPNRYSELKRGMIAAAKDLGFNDARTFCSHLLSTPPDKLTVEALATHLTVGETYFFRDRRLFSILESEVLPDLIEERGKTTRMIRLWSAGCCTGEEAYSLAIVVNRLIPDPKSWKITILGTDVSPYFLAKAREGMYAEWAFRETEPEVRRQYFRHAAKKQYELVPAIRNMVSFGYVNLAQDMYPSLLNGTNAMDIILCRNVLMYFTPEIACRTVERLRRTLTDSGWLFVSPVEVSLELMSGLRPVQFEGVTGFRNSYGAEAGKTSPSVLPAGLQPLAPAAVSRKTLPAAGRTGPPVLGQQMPDPVAMAGERFAAGSYAEAEAVLNRLLAQKAGGAAAFALLARIHANRGRLDAAQAYCARALALEPLNPEYLCLLAAVQEERGKEAEAAATLRRALYADPAYVPAYFSLAHIAGRSGNRKEAERNFNAALRLLSAMKNDTVLPGTDGVTAGRLAEIIAAVQVGAGTV